METHLEACTVPTVTIGQVEVPRLIMGIHPFDGYGYIGAEKDAFNAGHFSHFDRIVQVISWVASQGVTAVQTDHTAEHLNRQHLVAVHKASQQTGISLATIPFLYVPVTLDGQLLDHRRVYATLDRSAFEREGEAYREYLRADPIVQYMGAGQGAVGEDFLVSHEEVEPFSADEFGRMAVDYERFNQYLGFFAGVDPFIADAGCEVDFLAAGGRFDLMEEYIAFLRRHYPAVITSIHHPGVTIPLLDEQDVSFDGYMTPVNKLGVFMLPTPDSALTAIRASRKPIISIKPMGGGRLLDREAFDYVLNDVGVAATLFGLGTIDEVTYTVSEARQALGLD
ncbi:hypothetical protein ACFL6X_04805 [Candidatus Latescibacterota bacterium]